MLDESEREGRGGGGGPSFTMDMWASEAAISCEAEALEEALHSQLSQVQSLPRAHFMCSDVLTRRRVLWRAFFGATKVVEAPDPCLVQ